MRRIGYFLLAAALLVGCFLMPGELLSAQEWRVYDQKNHFEVLTPQFSANTGTLFQRLNILVQYGEATHISDEAGSELYYDTKTLLKRYHQELTVLAETNVLAKNMLPALEDLLEQWRQDAGVLTVGYSCAVDLSTGDTYVLSYLSSAIPTLYLEMDMASGKLIDFSVSANLCQEPEQVSADMWSCALSLAEYLGVTSAQDYQVDDSWYYRFREPDGDGSAVLFCIQPGDVLQMYATGIQSP